jgi:hypothetical protein
VPGSCFGGNSLPGARGLFLCGELLSRDHERPKPGHAPGVALVDQDRERLASRQAGDALLLDQPLDRRQPRPRRQLPGPDLAPQPVGDLLVRRHVAVAVDRHQATVRLDPDPGLTLRGLWQGYGKPWPAGHSITGMAEEQDELWKLRNEYPGWYIARGTDNRWHARLRGTTPPVMVADDHLDGLREEIVRKVSQLEAADYERRGAS